MNLTPTQLRIVRYLAFGYSTEEIAGFEQVSEQAIKHTIARVRRDTNIQSRSGIVGAAYRAGILDPADKEC